MHNSDATTWPSEPYRELDFFTVADSELFRERAAEVMDCLQLLTAYGTKILLLHGSSGSGKSSFLRAGLIPRMRDAGDRPAFCLLPGDDGVVRCTGDPVRAIARAVLAAMPGDRTARAYGTHEELALKKASEGPLSASCLSAALEGARSEPLVEPLLGAVSELRRSRRESLVLVVDQAEEVLTQSEDLERVAAFFKFIEELYLRDFDVRLVVSLRTEYYGRFRNRLRITDGLRRLPEDGGLELYLLNSLRNPTALVDALSWPACNAEHEYGFRFRAGALRAIVDDVLAELPNAASVTPALQVVCATLTEGRNEKRPIEVTFDSYQALGGLHRILDGFIDSSIATATARLSAMNCRAWSGNGYTRLLTRLAGPRSVPLAGAFTVSATDRWRSILATMVSEQGGGVVVAMPRSESELEQATLQNGLSGNVRDALRSMANGRGAVLRRIGTDTEPVYILKHDTLAVRLSRWNQQQVSLRKFRHDMKLAFAIGTLLLGVVLTAFFATSFSGLAARNGTITLRTNFAERAPTSDLRLSLLVLLANLAETNDRYNLADRIWPSTIHDESLAALRRTLLRSPWFTGTFAAVGIDPTGTQLVLEDMERTGVNLLILPDREAQKNPWEILKRLDLGPTERQISDPTPPAVGFVTGLGPVLVQNHEVFFWPDIANAAKHQPVEAKMADFNNEAPRRYEISGGAIQASQFGPGRRPMIARLDFQALTDPTGQRKRAPYTFSNPEPFGPMPVFDNVSSIGRMARFQSFPEEHPSDDHRLIRDPAVEWSRDFDESEAVPIKITVHRTDEASEEHDVSLPVILTAKSPERIGRFGLAFVTGQENIIAFKPSGTSFYLKEIALASKNVPPSRFTLEPKSPDSAKENKLLPPQSPFVHPLLAVAKTLEGWRAAWMVGRGVQAVETCHPMDGDGLGNGEVCKIRDDVLISGASPGSRLAFSKDGRYLMLEQTMPDRRSAVIKVWDLSREWRQKIETESNELELRTIACRVIARSDTSGFEDMNLTLFRIPPRYKEPCSGE